MSPMELYELREFGALADRHGRHAIEEGGYIVPAPDAPPTESRRKEFQSHAAARQGQSEARPAAGSRQRPPEATASGPAGHPVEHLLGEVLKLEELYEYHPDARILGISSSFFYMAVPVGLFRSLPYRAHLLLEIPLVRPDLLAWPRDRVMVPSVAVPDVRAWAYWSDGILITSHHTNPDLSICACMPDDWRWGLKPLHEYVEHCMVWIGKTLHTQLLGRWPGTQHYAPSVCLQRNPLDEYCHCGSDLQWAECHREEDLSTPAYSRILGEQRAHLRYLAKLRRQGRAVGPPTSRAIRAFVGV